MASASGPLRPPITASVVAFDLSDGAARPVYPALVFGGLFILGNREAAADLATTRDASAAHLHASTMTRALLHLLPLALLATAASAQPAGDARPNGVPLDSLARVFAEAGGLPSLVLGVVADGQRWVVGVGEVDGAAPDAHTLYEIGSVSKVLTSLALADAVARGETTLETPVADLLPDSVTVGAHPDGPIRLVDLATHTSGLPRLDLGVGLAPGFDLADPYARYDADRLYAFLATAEPATAPGTAYEYSNLGGGLLGFALAQRAGEPYADVVRQRVLAPLGMDETWVVVPDSAAGRLAQGHGPDGAPVPHWTWTEPTAGAGGWRSSAADLLTLAQAALDPAATPLADALERSLVPRFDIGGGGQIGLGWHTGQIDDVPVVWHNGGTGGFRSFLVVAPGAGRAVVVLTNRQIEADGLGVEVMRALRAAE